MTMSPILLDLPQGPDQFHRLVLDFTGTLAEDGALIPGVADRLHRLAEVIDITVITADTFGSARGALEGVPVEIRIIADGREKARLVESMAKGAEGSVVAIGNGRNDIPMMAVAGLGIAVIGPEGAASGLLSAAQVVCRDINDALDLLLHPLRLKATLRD
jgi:soluble P-type ATPase